MIEGLIFTQRLLHHMVYWQTVLHQCRRAQQKFGPSEWNGIGAGEILCQHLTHDVKVGGHAHICYDTRAGTLENGQNNTKKYSVKFNDKNRSQISHSIFACHWSMVIFISSLMYTGTLASPSSLNVSMPASI